MELGKPNLVVFAETLQALAGADKDILVVTSDSRGSGKLGPFGKALPDQIVEVGIAEQNLVGNFGWIWHRLGKRCLVCRPLVS